MYSFFHVYWYGKANDTIAEFGNLAGSAKAEIWQAMGIQLVFAAAIVCIAMAAGKRKG